MTVKTLTKIETDTSMINNTITTDTGDSRDRLIRVEERLKHMDESTARALRDLKEAIVDLAHGSKTELEKTQTRLANLESRVDRIYWLWGVTVFVGSPIMVIITKISLARFGF